MCTLLSLYWVLREDWAPGHSCEHPTLWTTSSPQGVVTDGFTVCVRPLAGSRPLSYSQHLA